MLKKIYFHSSENPNNNPAKLKLDSIVLCPSALCRNNILRGEKNIDLQLTLYAN